jgi:hypothetical protein
MQPRGHVCCGPSGPARLSRSVNICGKEVFISMGDKSSWRVCLLLVQCACLRISGKHVTIRKLREPMGCQWEEQWEIFPYFTVGLTSVILIMNCYWLYWSKFWGPLNDLIIDSVVLYSQTENRRPTVDSTGLRNYNFFSAARGLIAEQTWFLLAEFESTFHFFVSRKDVSQWLCHLFDLYEFAVILRNSTPP